MTPSEQIDQLIAATPDWRGKTLASLRRTILEADPAIVEGWKWKGSPVWEKDGMIAVANPHKDKVKVTFSHGASLPDPKGLFNNGFNGNVWRAIDLREGDRLDPEALMTLVRAAIAFNEEKRRSKAKKIARGGVTRPS